MSKIIDISVAIQSKMVIWPGSFGVRLSRSEFGGSGGSGNISQLDCDVHIGTHVDAPRHFVSDGATVEQLAVERMVGDCFVAYLPDVRSIGGTELDGIFMPESTRRLLLRTGNSELWSAGGGFVEDYAGLTADGAEWVVENKIDLIGIDYLSVQRYEDGPAAHELLLGAGTIILEGLNLRDVEPGEYELICLPLKLCGAEAAPARVILRSQ